MQFDFCKSWCYTSQIVAIFSVFGRISSVIQVHIGILFIDKKRNHKDLRVESLFDLRVESSSDVISVEGSKSVKDIGHEDEIANMS